jgi:hypothetical protein
LRTLHLADATVTPYVAFAAFTRALSASFVISAGVCARKCLMPSESPSLTMTWRSWRRSEGVAGLVDADPWLDKKCVGGGAFLTASTYDLTRVLGPAAVAVAILTA